MNKLSLEFNNSTPVDFSHYCPFLKGKAPRKPVGFFFAKDDESVIGSQTGCENGGLPGVDKLSDRNTLMPINPDRLAAYCEGCPSLVNGFVVEIEEG